MLSADHHRRVFDSGYPGPRIPGPAAVAPAVVFSAPPAPSQLEAHAAWENAIESCMAKGMNRERAAAAVVRERPELQRALIQSHKPPRPTPRPSVGFTCEDYRRLQAAWRGAINAAVSSGIRPADALSSAAKANQVLRQEVVQAGNEHAVLVRAGRCTCPKEPTYMPVIG